MGAHVDNILALLQGSEWLGLHFTSMGTHKVHLCPPHLPPTQPRPPENSLETAALIPFTPPERNWATERGAICLGSHNLKGQGRDLDPGLFAPTWQPPWWQWPSGHLHVAFGAEDIGPPHRLLWEMEIHRPSLGCCFESLLGTGEESI